MKKTEKPNKKFDDDSVELLEALENGEKFNSIKNLPGEKKSLQKSAQNYFKKDARVSFRVSSVDLDNIKRMAAEEGIPYQTYLAGIIHKLTTGKLEQRF